MVSCGRLPDFCGACPWLGDDNWCRSSNRLMTNVGYASRLPVIAVERRARDACPTFVNVLLTATTFAACFAVGVAAAARPFVANLNQPAPANRTRREARLCTQWFVVECRFVCRSSLAAQWMRIALRGRGRAV